MAAATALVSADNSESCLLCLSKYNRTRPSFCQCKHCSIPFCFDCTREHHEELLQDVAKISHQYNEIQELLQNKQKMIVDETTKSIEDVNQYFETYIKELRETQHKIILDIERAKQDAHDYMVKIGLDLHKIGIDVQSLSKENVVQMTKMKTLPVQLTEIGQQVNMCRATKIENLLKIKPTFSIKFGYPPTILQDTPQSFVSQTTKIQPINANKSSSDMNPLNTTQQPATQQILGIQSKVLDSAHDKDCHSNTLVDSNSSIQNYHLPTSYTIDRMASDGQNIMYTSYFDERSDLIAYCYMNKNINSPDKYRDWNQSRITDLIWWNSIGKFVCATDEGIYTVDYINKTFKIRCAIREKWSFTRVAANMMHLFMWVNPIKNDFNGIEVYSTKFEHIRTIDFHSSGIRSFVVGIVSFCVTENLIASICTRMQNKGEVVQLIFCDMNMKKLNSVPLGRCSGNIEIRTNGNDRFFITTGYSRFYIVSSNGAVQRINLREDGNCIAVLDNRRVAIDTQSNSMEIFTY